MNALIFVLMTTITVIWVAIRRIFRGPLHPGWSYRFEAITEILRKANDQGLSMPVARMRRAMIDARIHPKIARLVSHERSTFAGLPAETFTPKSWTPADPTLLYLHGGGYIVCSPSTHRDLISRIAAAASARTIAIDYRKAPEHPFPAPIDDCEAAYRELLREGTPPGQLFVGGDSAGGGLALALLLRARDLGLPLPRGAVLLSPWVDLECGGESISTNSRFDYLPARGLSWTAEQYLQGGDRRHPHASPVHAELAGLPPLLIQTGGAELFLTENQRLAERARAAGVDVTHQVDEGMVHVFQAFTTFVPACNDAIRRIGEFVRSLSAVVEDERAAE